ncbi:MAG: hypothetical protein E7562_06730 [Ruminococcaceae bacterium]|nr:hypothetical protein [Oscillospiraceae bacterium]
MKKKILSFVYILTAIVVAINTFFSVYDSLYFTMDDLPEGEEIYSVASPSGNQVLTVYSINNSLGTAVRAAVKNGKKVRNLYWQTGLSQVDSGWINEGTVVINDVRINVKNGSYDCRKGYSIFSEGALEGKDVEEAPVKKSYE